MPKIIIERDEDPLNPRTEGENFGKMVCFHKRYSLGDIGHGLKSEDFDGWLDLKRYLVKEKNAGVILPLYLYDHSGITMSTEPFSCPFDSGQVGFTYATKEDCIREFGNQRMGRRVRVLATQALKMGVKTYDQYLTGDVWGYRILDDDGEEVDSCWGIFGEDECRETAEEAINEQT